MDCSVSNNAMESLLFDNSKIIKMNTTKISTYSYIHINLQIFFFSKIGIGNMNTNAKSNFAVMGSSLKLNSLSSCLVKMQAHTIQQT